MRIANFCRIILPLCCVAAAPAYAADHNDSPLVAQDSRLDITDVFAFRSPQNPANIVLIVGHFTPEVLGEGVPQFSTDGSYDIFVDTDDDFKPDTIIKFTFQDLAGGGQSFDAAGIPGVGTLSGTVTPPGADPIIATGGGASAFAGTRDDPFYFDLEAFRNIVTNPCIPAAGIRCPGTGAPVNFFKDRNIAAIAVEFPITNMPEITSSDAGTLHVWSKTFEG